MKSLDDEHLCGALPTYPLLLLLGDSFLSPRFVFSEREGFVQLVVPRVTCLRVVSVVHRFAITMQIANTAK